MDFIYAPWRSPYFNDRGRAKQPDTTEKECVFCTQLQQNQDEKNFILKRGDHFSIMLNKYPYNPGHLMVVSFDHVPDLESFTPEQRAELIELITQGTTLLKNELRAQGINVGVNLGKAAGAGIPSHFHMHILPRWIGDTNFLPLLSGTKQISVDLHEVYQKLQKAL